MNKCCKVVVRNDRMFQFLNGNHILKIQWRKADLHYKWSLSQYRHLKTPHRHLKTPLLKKFHRAVVSNVPTLIAALFEE